MKTSAYHILRVGLGVTFLWIGVLIFRDPVGWGSYLQPWAAQLLPVPIEQAMIGTAAMDVVVGLLFLVDIWVWVAGAVGAVHLAIVLTTVGINEVTVRDIGLLTGTIALFWMDLPEAIKKKLPKHS